MGKFIPVEPEKWGEMVKAMAEVAELKAEVIRLQQVRGYEHYLSAEIGSMHQENVRLKAEVERLTEAGDEMAVCFNCPTCAKNWNDAKKGGQP